MEIHVPADYRSLPLSYAPVSLFLVLLIEAILKKKGVVCMQKTHGRLVVGRWSRRFRRIGMV